MWKRIAQVTQGQLTRGLKPRDCSRAIATSLTVGVFPIMGFSTPMNTLAAAAFKLNQPVVLGFNWIIGPIKLALIFPFLRLGEFIFRAEPFRLSLSEFSRRFFNDMAATSSEFAWTFVHVIVGWMVCAPVIYLMLYWLALYTIGRRSNALQARRAG